MASNENSVICDPFAGSATTGIAANLLNRDFVGIEKEQEFIDIALAFIYTNYLSALDTKSAIWKKIRRIRKDKIKLVFKFSQFIKAVAIYKPEIVTHF